MIDPELIKKADAGDIEAMMSLASSLEDENNPDSDKKKAFELYKKVYETKPERKFAAYKVILAYQSGKGVEKDIEEAYRIEKKEAERNELAAFLYSYEFDDDGMEPCDVNKQVYWLKIASDADINGAKKMLAFILQTGYRGYPKDEQAAQKLIEGCQNLTKEEVQEWIDNLYKMYKENDGFRRIGISHAFFNCLSDYRLSYHAGLYLDETLEALSDSMRIYYPTQEDNDTLHELHRYLGAIYFGKYISKDSIKYNDEEYFKKAIEEFDLAGPLTSQITKLSSGVVCEFVNFCEHRAIKEGKRYDSEIFKAINDYYSLDPKSAEQAMIKLGSFYVTSFNDIPKHDQKAVYYTKRAAELGNITAKFNLMGMTFYGVAMDEDNYAAEKLAHELVNCNDPLASERANYVLAYINFHGSCGTKDWLAALNYGKKAVSMLNERIAKDEKPKDDSTNDFLTNMFRDEAAFKNQLNILNDNKVSLLYDYEVLVANICVIMDRYNESFEIFEKYARNGEDYCEFQLGLHYYEGKARPADRRIAYYWLNRSAEHGNESAKEFLRNHY